MPDVRVQRVSPQLTAVVRFRASQSELSTLIPQACGKVWSFVRAAGIANPGRHLAIYFDCEMNIECGVEVQEQFSGNGEIFCSSTPEGTAATAAHIGPYNCLGQTHDAVRQWCADQGYKLAGPSWEIYGHWTDDPSKLRTDVYWLLADES